MLFLRKIEKSGAYGLRATRKKKKNCGDYSRKPCKNTFIVALPADPYVDECVGDGDCEKRERDADEYGHDITTMNAMISTCIT